MLSLSDEIHKHNLSGAVYLNITSAAPSLPHVHLFIEHCDRAREYVHFWLTQQLRRSGEAACRSGLNHLNAVGKGKSVEEACEGKKQSRQPCVHTRQSDMTELCVRLLSAPQAESAHTHTHTHTPLAVTSKQSAVSSATSSCLSLCPNHTHTESMKVMECK